MIWRSILYNSPDNILWLCAVPLFLIGFTLLYRYRQQHLNNFASAETLELIVTQRTGYSYVLKSGLFLLAWFCAVLAIMEPKGNGRYAVDSANPAERASSGKIPMHDLIFLVDVSASMNVQDGYGGRTRLEYAKGVVENLIGTLKGESVSLYAFTSTLMQIVPITNDYLFTRLMARQLQLNEGETKGTNLLQTFDRLFKILSAQPQDRLRTVIILTDGGDTLYEIEKGDAQRERLFAILKPVEEIFQKHVRLVTIGIGTENGGSVPGVNYEGKSVSSVIQEALLQRITGVSQGQYYAAQEFSPLQLANEIGKILAENTRGSTENGKYVERGFQRYQKLIYDEYYQIPLAVAIFALVLSIVVPSTSLERRRNG